MRILKLSLQNSFRNFWLSLASIVIMLLMLLSLSLIYCLNVIGQETLTYFKDKMDLGIYLKQNINESTVNLLRTELESMDEIKEIRYLTPEQSLEEFEQKHRNDQLILKSLRELKENPLGATITLKFYNPEDYQKVLSVISQPEYQDLIQNQDFYDYQKLIRGFSKFNQKISYLGLGISGVFIFVAILVIFNTIKLGALSQQKQIKIMKLVGATSRFVRAPFLIQSCFYSLVAWILDIGILVAAAVSVQPYIQQLLELNFDFLLYLKTDGLVFLICLLIFSLFVSTISSGLAIRKYLKI